MRIKNDGPAAHTLSIGGKDYTLAPGNFVDLPLTGAEAEAIPAPFTASGEPVPAPVFDADKREVKK